MAGKLSKAQIAVLANLARGCGLVTSASFGNTFWSNLRVQPKMRFILPSTARKLHALGMIERRELLSKGGQSAWNLANTFLTNKGEQALTQRRTGKIAAHKRREGHENGIDEGTSN